MRTIKQFISKTNKVYFFFNDTHLCKQFYRNAEEEGITFGGTNPTEKKPQISLHCSLMAKYATWVGQVECATTTAKKVWYALITRSISITNPTISFASKGERHARSKRFSCI